MFRYIDPPEGWRYGFPKRFDGDEADVNAWLLANGYPQASVDLWPQGVPFRIIIAEHPMECFEDKE